jgi:hypothetical protein
VYRPFISWRKEQGLMDDFSIFLQYEKEVAESRLKIIDRFQKEGRVPSKKRTSIIDLVEQILKDAGRPLHISEIIEIAAKDHDVKLERDSVVSFLIKRIKAGKVFSRTAPNTFALR